MHQYRANIVLNYVAFNYDINLILCDSLLQNTVVNSPVLFLKLSEDTVGEFDLVMTPKSTAESQRQEIIILRFRSFI